MTAKYLDHCKKFEELHGTLYITEHKGMYLSEESNSAYSLDDETAEKGSKKWLFYAIQFDDCLYLYHKGFPLASEQMYHRVSLVDYDVSFSEVNSVKYITMTHGKYVLKFKPEFPEEFDYWEKNIPVWKQYIESKGKKELLLAPRQKGDEEYTTNYNYFTTDEFMGDLDIEQEKTVCVGSTRSEDYPFTFGMTFPPLDDPWQLCRLGEDNEQVLAQMVPSLPTLEKNAQVLQSNKTKIYDTSHRDIFETPKVDKDTKKCLEDESVGENTIVEVFQQGYELGDKVLRFAMVKVAN